MTAPKDHPTTPDGRYFVVRGRLWRKANPALAPERREALVKQLMDARRALRKTNADADRAVVRGRVDEAKRALGERGPVWWDDGAPDYNRRMARNTPYADWFAGLRLDDGRTGRRLTPARRRPTRRARDAPRHDAHSAGFASSRASRSRSAFSARKRSVQSRPTAAAPSTVPAASTIRLKLRST